MASEGRNAPRNPVLENLQERERSNPQFRTARSKLQSQRMAVNERINKEMRMKMGAETLLKASQGKKQKQRVEQEMKFVDSTLQLLKDELEELNSALGTYQSFETLPMIPLAYKDTISINFTTPFKNFLLDHYNQPPEPFLEAIDKVTSMRNRIISAPRKEESIRFFIKYINLLNILDRRFFPPGGNLGLVFTWFDSFSGVPFQQKSIAFEKASILFNLAALYSQLATALDRSNSQTLSQAQQLFQLSAGTLHFLREHYEYPPNPDMKSEILQMLQSVMKVQAQECYLLELGCHAHEVKDEEAVYHGITYAAEALFIAERSENIYSDLRNNILQHVEIIPQTWISLLQTKSLYYSAIGYEAASISLEKIAYLQRDWSVSGENERALVLIEKALEKMKILTRGKHFVRPPQSDLEFFHIALSCAQKAHSHIEEGCQELELSKHLRSIPPVVERMNATKRRLLERSEHLRKQAESRLASQAAAAQAKNPQPPSKSSLANGKRSATATHPQQWLDLYFTLPNFYGFSNCECDAVLPDLDSMKLTDPFFALGPIAVFNARQKHSFPKCVTIAKLAGPKDSGFGFSISGERPCILVTVEENTPAWNAGLRPNDILVSVGDEDVRWATHEAVSRKIHLECHRALQRSLSEQINLTVVTPQSRALLAHSVSRNGDTNTVFRTMSTSDPERIWEEAPIKSKKSADSTSWKKRLSGTWLFRKRNKTKRADSSST